MISAYVSYARYFLDMLALGSSRSEEDAERATVENWDVFLDLRNQYGGVIVVSSHVGSWDFGAYWFTRQGDKISAVAERLEPPELAEWFEDFRRALGVEVIFVGPNTAVEVAQRLKDGWIVALVADRDLEGNGLVTELLGREVRLPLGPALLAERSGAPMIPCAIYNTPHGGHHIVFGEPILPSTRREGSLRERVEAMTVRLSHVYEAQITHAPAQWHVFVPFWLDDQRVGPDGSDKNGSLNTP